MIATYPLEEIWPFVSPVLEKALWKQGKPLQMVSRIYQLCKAQKCCIYNSRQDNSFCIVELRIDPDTKDLVMFVWAAFGVNGARLNNEDILHTLASQLGAVQIEFVSRRRGFEKTGWDIQDITYRRAVTAKEGDQ
jgi:hypothetical protein